MDVHMNVYGGQVPGTDDPAQVVRARPLGGEGGRAGTDGLPT